MAQVVSLSMCKDEADVAEPMLRHLAGQVDHMLVIDNGSTDGTRDILADLARDLPLTIYDDPEVGYYQSRRMTALAHRADEEMGAEWVVPVDFDEWWYSPFGRIADVLAKLHGCSIVAAPLYDHRPTALDDADDPNPFTRIGWRDRDPAPLVKVACRPQGATIEMGNHSATYSSGEAVIVPGQLVVRHFPYRSVEQFITKARNGSRAMAATDMPDSTCAHWRSYGQLYDAGGPEALAAVYHRWFHRPDPTESIRVDDEVLPSLIFDPAPT